MDEVIFEEFKGHRWLSRKSCWTARSPTKRVYPAIDVIKSGTRKEELITPKEHLTKTSILRRILVPMGAHDDIEFLLVKLPLVEDQRRVLHSR